LKKIDIENLSNVDLEKLLEGMCQVNVGNFFIFYF
jgi:hypothetical protein